MQFKKFKKIYLILFSFSILLFFYFPISWTDNELHYFGMAQFNFDKSYENFSYYHFSKLKYLFGYIHGFFIDLFGIESAWFYLRILTLFLYSIFIINFIFFFNFKSLTFILSLIFFVLLNQNFTGGSWLFQGFESKILSYIIFFLSFKLICEKHYKFFIFLSVISIYSHFQAAFFCISFNLLFFLIYKKDFKKFLHLIFFIFIFSLPFLFQVILEFNFSTNLDISKIYFERVYAQSSIFDLQGKISTRNLFGICLMIAFLFIEIIFFKIKKNNSLNDKILYLLISSIFLKVYLIICILFDFLIREKISTFFIYRPSSISLIISLLIFFEIILSYYSNNKNKSILLIAVLLLISPIFLKKYTFNNIEKIIFSRLNQIKNSTVNFYKYGYSMALNVEEVALLKWVQNNTEKNDIILVEENSVSNFNFKSLKPTAFEKNANRPSKINDHNIFGSKKDIERWYKLNNQKSDLMNGNCNSNNELESKYLLYFDKKKSQLVSKDCKFENVFSTENLNLLKTNN